MNIGFDCPHCGLSMEASIDNGGGNVRCLGCGKEFVVDASQPVLPVVTARAVSPRVASPAPHPPPRAPQHHSGLAPRPQGYDRPRFEPPVRKKSSNENNMPFYGLGAVFVLLIGMVVWLFSSGSTPKSGSKAGTGTPAAHAPMSADAEKVNAELEAIKDALAAREKREAEQVEEQKRKETEFQDAIQMAIDTKKQEQHDEARDEIARTAFDGNAVVAEACLQAYQNVLYGLGSLMNDGNPSNDLKSDRELNDYVVKGLIVQFNSIPTLRKWTTEHQKNLETLIPELVRKSMPGLGSGSVASSNNFDFSKYRSTGSGFFISSDGWILTNEHVVLDSREVELRLRDGRLLRAEVIKTDEANDLALLKADLNASSWLAVTKGTVDLSLGRTVFTVGYPDPTVQGVEPKFTDGRVSAASGIGDRKDSYQTTVPVQHGNSGGALVDFATGWVVGVVSSKLESSSGVSADNVSYSIKGNVVSTFLESVPEAKAAAAKFPPKLLPKGDERAVIDCATDSSVLILRPR